GGDLEAARARSGIEGAAEGDRAFAHAGDPDAVPAAVAVALPPGVVFDRDGEPVVSVRNPDACRGFGGVPGRVGERLLHDSDRRQLHSFRYPFGLLALDLEFNVGARLAEAVNQRADTVEAGSGLERNVSDAWLAEDAEDRAQLVERVVARRLDRCERVSRATGLALGEMGGDAGLHVDRGQRVRDDVVEIARDPQPFLLSAALRLLLTCALGQLEPLEQQLNVRAAVAQRLSSEHRDGDQRYVRGRL